MSFEIGAIIALFILLAYLAKQNFSLRKCLVRDPLTGILNKVGLEAQVKPSISHFIRSGESYCYLYLDLKGFKRINDQIGRHEADEILKVLAAEVSARLRTEALFGRLSGDEFLLAMPATLNELSDVLDRVFAPALAVCSRYARHFDWPEISGRIGIATMFRGEIYGTWWNPAEGLLKEPFCKDTIVSNEPKSVMHSMLGLAHQAMERAK